MTDVKITKLFKDLNTGEDVYILSIQMDEHYFNIPLNKKQFSEIFYKIRAIHDNTELE